MVRGGGDGERWDDGGMVGVMVRGGGDGGRWGWWWG